MKENKILLRRSNIQKGGINLKRKEILIPTLKRTLIPTVKIASCEIKRRNKYAKRKRTITPLPMPMVQK